MRGLVGPPEGCHVAVFQDDPASLLHHIRSFVDSKLERGGAVLLVVEPTVAQAYRGWADQQRPSIRHRCIILDAGETVEQVCLDDRIDPERFEARIGGLLRRLALAGNGRMAIVSEMAGLLWRQGRQMDAVALEALWHDAAERSDMRLLCTYSHAAFHNDPVGVCRVLHLHSHVETLTVLQPEDEVSIPVPREPHAPPPVLPGRPRRPAAPRAKRVAQRR